MAPSPTVLARALVFGLGVAALFAGMAVGASGCGICTRPCPGSMPLDRGMYSIIESPDRPELVGGQVEITDDAFVIAFADADGHEWVVDYTFE
ncbi:hypothetical protein [Nannocystis radixulma]|uniref:Uncharacterized protein n=1 Tax=Nannocystis radixulma TaxID=2995305 RepID=A0ABT5BJA4_9BACT|nr:hypothetical protein [Nannocystis radixulma]MDC0674239.1 hypothetical protein [Nannocystis radixulma]